MCTCACIAGGVPAEVKSEIVEEETSEILAEGASEFVEEGASEFVEEEASEILEEGASEFVEETATDPILAEAPVSNATLADILEMEVKPEEPVRKKSKLKSAQIALELPIRVRGVFE